MSTAHAPSTLFEELATLFSSAPSPQTIVEFHPSQASMDRASELLELNRQNRLTDADREEINQFEQAELLIRLVKARIRAAEASKKTPR